MNNCIKCGNKIPSTTKIDGKVKKLNKNRIYCLVCKPHNQRCNWSEQDLKSAVASSKNLSEIFRKLGLRSLGNNFKTLKKYIEKFNIDASHLNGREQSQEAFKSKQNQKEKSYDAIFCEHSDVARSTTKKYILKYKLIPYKCNNCDILDFIDGIPYWNNKPVILQLEHKNGIRNDNRLDNLCWLCPTCHSQTETYAGRKNSLVSVANSIKKFLNVDPTKKRNEKLNLPEKTLDAIAIINCEFCKKEFKPVNRKIKFCSEICGHRANAKAKYKISKEELEKLVWEKPLTSIGIIFGVSGGAVKKWCKSYEIRVPGRGYWAKKAAGKIL